MDEIEEAIEEAKAQVGEHFIGKAAGKVAQVSETETGKGCKAQTVKDDVVAFEQLGVDRLFVDESQAFKNLYLYTKIW